RRMGSLCCARAASGHAATAPPTKRMNWRRLIVTPEAQARNGSNLRERSGGGGLGPMSALGHKRTCAVQKAMSALPPKADMCGAVGYVRFGPKADMTPLFDNLIGAGKYRRRNCEAHCLRGFEIDRQFVLGRCLHW